MLVAARTEAIFERRSRAIVAPDISADRQLSLLANITALRVICQHLDATTPAMAVYIQQQSRSRVDASLYISLSL